MRMHAGNAAVGGQGRSVRLLLQLREAVSRTAQGFPFPTWYRDALLDMLGNAS